MKYSPHLAPLQDKSLMSHGNCNESGCEDSRSCDERRVNLPNPTRFSKEEEWMKKLSLVLVVALVAMLAFSGAVVASEPTEGTEWQTPCEGINSFLNENAGHTHQYKTIEDPYGVGANIKVIKFENKFVEDVTVETKYDFENDLYSGFVVVNLDASSLWGQ